LILIFLRHNEVATSSGIETKASKTDDLSDPDVIAQEIVEDLEAASATCAVDETLNACAISTETVDRGTTETFAALLLKGHV
jgi:hypothetical protein